LSWQWDGRLGAVLAEFLVDRKDDIRKTTESFLGHVWDSTNIETAPNVVQIIAIKLGSLREEQFLFTSDPNQDVLIYGAWWPWGNGKYISLRLAPHDRSLSDTEQSELKNKFRGWFSL
jgi:hypothetical protein